MHRNPISAFRYSLFINFCQSLPFIFNVNIYCSNSQTSKLIYFDFKYTKILNHQFWILRKSSLNIFLLPYMVYIFPFLCNCNILNQSNLYMHNQAYWRNFCWHPLMQEIDNAVCVVFVLSTKILISIWIFISEISLEA